MNKKQQTEYTKKIIKEKKSTQRDFGSYADEHYEYWQEQSERCLFDKDNGFVFTAKAEIFSPTMTTCSQELFRFAALMSEDSNCGLTNFSYMHSKLYLNGVDRYSGCPNELVIRFSKDIIVVKDVEFIHKRKGYMTRVYEYLVEIAQKYEVPKIEIESVVSDEMHNWCKKHKFKKKNEDYFIDVQQDSTREERLIKEGNVLKEAYFQELKKL